MYFWQKNTTSKKYFTVFKPWHKNATPKQTIERSRQSQGKSALRVSGGRGGGSDGYQKEAGFQRDQDQKGVDWKPRRFDPTLLDPMHRVDSPLGDPPLPQ